VALAFATVDMHPVALTSVRHRLADRPADYVARLRLRVRQLEALGFNVTLAQAG
jgi:hypothetical protein